MKKITAIIVLSLFCGMICNAKTTKTAKIKNDSITNSQRVNEIRDSLNSIMDQAKAGDASAMNEVGIWYYTGKHVKLDYKQAYEWWKKAALKSNVRAIANLGMCYQYGRGVEKDSTDAMRLYKKSIVEGNSSLFNQREGNISKSAFDAMLVGDCYENGIGVKKNLIKAAEAYSQAALKGSVEGMKLAGLSYINSKKNELALKFFEKAASYGDVTSEYWAGKILLGDMGVSANKPKAVVYLLKAAEQGMPTAQVEMGVLYAEGNGVTRNLEQSVEWYRKAAIQGNAKGMWNYAMVLKDGVGVSQNYNQALFWMSEAASQGYNRSFKKMIAQMDSIGNDPFLNYVNGMKYYLVDGKMKEASNQFKKVEKAKIVEGKIMQMVVLASKRNEKSNPKKAAKEFEKLAANNAEASFYLATMYETGNGVEQNMAKALELYKKSSDMGYGKAQCYLADIYYEGRCIGKDIVTAVDLYLKAYENHQLTQNGAVRLAECYERGLAGLTTDKKKAESFRNYKYNDNVYDLLVNNFKQ